MHRNCDPKCLDDIAAGDKAWVYNCESSRKSHNKAWVPKGGKSSSTCLSLPLFKEGSPHDFLQLKRSYAAETFQTWRDDYRKVLHGFGDF